MVGRMGQSSSFPEIQISALMHGDESTLPCTASIFVGGESDGWGQSRNLENWKTGTPIPGIALHRPDFRFPEFQRSVHPSPKICNAATSMPSLGCSVAATLRIMPGCATPPRVMPQCDTLRVCGVLSATPSAMSAMVFGQTLRCGGKIPRG